MPPARFADLFAADAPERPRRLWIFAALFVAVFLAYFPALTGGMLWDDDGYVTPPALRSLEGLGRIWTDLRNPNQFYPLLHSAFWLEHQLWGDAVLGYHLVNVILHAGSACLFGLILRRLNLPGAWFAAALFAVHPVNVETVAWISEQKNTLSTFFYLAAALAYLRFAERRERLDYALSSALFACALLSKTVTLSLPAALLVVFWWRRGALDWRRDVVPLLPWFGVGVVAAFVTSWVERHALGAQGAEFALSASEVILLAPRAVWFYLGKLLWPLDLVPIYSRWNLQAAAGYFALVAFLLAAAACWLGRRRWRGPLAAGLLFVGSLLPVLGFFQVYYFRYSFVADHWLYLPALGIFAAIAAVATRGAERVLASRQGLRPLVAVAVVAVLAVLTARQCSFYRNAEAFNRRILAYNANSWLAHNNLAFALMAAGKTADALRHFGEAVRLNPVYADARFNLATAEANYGGTLFRQGRYAEAGPYLERAVRSGLLAERPGYAQLLRDWSAVLVDAGRLAESRNAQGLALIHEGREPEAGEAFAAALRIQPDYAEARVNLAAWLAGSQRLEDAAAQYEAALRAKPDWPEAHSNLASVLLQLGRADDAVARYRHALQLAPANTDIRLQFALALGRLGRSAEAISECQQALQRVPNNASARRLLADLRAGKLAPGAK